MALRAMTLAENELRSDMALEASLNQALCNNFGANEPARKSAERLVAGIRRGEFDASDELFDFLQQVVAFKSEETGPAKSSD